MTEQELASQLFPRQDDVSESCSIITGTALSASSDGQVTVRIDGVQSGGAETGVVLPTTIGVAAGQSVIITLYGQRGQGKKGFVSGIVGGGGGGDPTLPGRVSTLEDEMDSAQASISTHATKINELVTALNRRGFLRLYFFSGTGNSKASLWYCPMTGQVVVGIHMNGTWAAGYSAFNSGSAIPSALRPLNGLSTAYPTEAKMGVWQGSNPTMIYSGNDGMLGGWHSSSGSVNDGGFITYLVKADMNYTSTISTVSSSIQPLTITRAYAARVALGDGLDVTSDEFEQTADAYAEAYDVIFGPDTSEER